MATVTIYEKMRSYSDNGTCSVFYNSKTGKVTSTPFEWSISSFSSNEELALVTIKNESTTATGYNVNPCYDVSFSAFGIEPNPDSIKDVIISNSNSRMMTFYPSKTYSFYVTQRTYLPGGSYSQTVKTTLSVNVEYYHSYTVSAQGCLTLKNQNGLPCLISSDNVLSNCDITRLTSTNVYQGGFVSNARVLADASLIVSNGGVVKKINIQDSGYMQIASGGSAYDLIFAASGGATVSSGGFATVVFTPWNEGKNNVIAHDGAIVQYLERDANVYYGHYAWGSIWSKGDIISEQKVARTEEISVFSGGTAFHNSVFGRCKVNSGGLAANTFVTTGGIMFVSSGGVANADKVYSAALQVSNGGMANDTKVWEGGRMWVYGTANNTEVASKGSLYIADGGVVSGQLQISSGACVSAFRGATIDFTVAEQTAPETALINKWGSITGRTDANYTVTVKSNQKAGTYSLADGALAFKSSVTIQNTAKKEIGVLAVNETKKMGRVSYTLDKCGNTLQLTVGEKTSLSDYNGGRKTDMIQFVNGKVYVTHDTASGYAQTDAVNDITGWNVTEIRRDLTGDGYADIQITADAGDGTTWVATLRNDYLKTSCITLNYQFIGAYDNRLWSYLGSADFNGDGKSEILMVQTEAGKDQYGHRNVAGWVTDDTTCQWIDNIWLGALNDGWNIAGTADVTGDGKDNVILRGADGMIGYWSEFGGMPEDIVTLKNAGNRVLITTGDFDGDGAEDFLWQSLSGNGEMSVWSGLNGAFTDVTIGKVSNLGGSWTFAGAGDYNADGKDEILWCDTSTYRIAYSEGNKENFTNLIQIT